jgi:hypothetical protein
MPRFNGSSYFVPVKHAEICPHNCGHSALNGHQTGKEH